MSTLAADRKKGITYRIRGADFLIKYANPKMFEIKSDRNSFTE